MKVQDYIELLEKIQEFTGDKDAALVILQEMGQDRRSESVGCTKDGAATPRQLSYLKKLNVDCPEDISKAEASRLIDEAREKD